MKYLVTCTVDEKQLAPVVELMAPYGQVIVRLRTGEPATPDPKPAAPQRRRVVLFRGTSSNGSGAALRVVADAKPGDSVNTQLKAKFAELGLAVDGAGATLSKLKARGFMRHGGMGDWKLTAKGENALARINWTAREQRESKSNDR